MGSRTAQKHTRGSRSEYFQGSVTDAFRRSEAELACSEISIVTTRTSVFRERRHPPIETAGALGVAGWVCDGRRSAPYLITTCISGAIGIARLFGAPTLARPRGGAPKSAAAGEKREGFRDLSDSRLAAPAKVRSSVP